MSALDELLERSNNPGSAVERHRFTLARDKAVEKMRDSALRDPTTAFIEVMVGAQLTGASYVGVNTDDEQIIIGWVGGKAIPPDALENLFDYLFADQANRATRHLQQLAVGVNGMLNGQASEIRIEVGDGTLEGSTRLDLSADGSAVLLDPTIPLDGGYVMARRRWTVQSWFRDSPALKECGLIEEKFQYTRIPILLNGSAPFGLRSNSAPFVKGPTTKVIKTDEFTVKLQAFGGKNPSKVVPVIGGSRVEAIESPLGRVQVVALHDGLRKTADMAKVVEDATWWRMMHTLRPHADTLMRSVFGDDVELAPPLPPIPEERPEAASGSTAAPTAVPEEELPEIIPSLVTRRNWKLDELAQLPLEMPILWVLPQEADLLGSDSDPTVAPWPIIQLSPGQAQRLHRALPSHTITRVGSAADLRYLRTVASRVASMAEATVSLRHLGIGGTLTVRLHHGPSGPCWEPSSLRLLPTAIVVDGRTRNIGYLPLRIANVSVTVQLETITPAAFSALWQDSATATERRLTALLVGSTLEAMWKVIANTELDPDSPGHVHVVTSLLASHLQCHFVEDSDSITVDVSLPVRAGRTARRLLDFPIATADNEPITAKRLAELATQRRTLRLDQEPNADLTALVNAVAPGTLVGPTPKSPTAAVLYSNGSVWRRVYQQHLPSDAHALILLKTQAEPTALPQPRRLMPQTWERIPTPSPFVEVLHSHQKPLQRDILTRGLNRAAQVNASLSPSATAPLIRMALAAMLNDPVIAPLRTSDNHPISAAAPTLRVVCLGGPRVQSRTVVEVSWHELQALQSLRRERGLPPAELLHDDPPDTWHALLDEPGWLLRAKVDLPAYRGWLGFRTPFDPTGGLLVETPSGHLSTDLSVPCHGVVWTEADTHDGLLPPELIDALEIRSLELLRQLAELLATTNDSTTRDTAEAYARALAEAGWQREDGPSAIQRRLASLLEAGSSTLEDKLDRDHGPNYPRLSTAGNTTLRRPEADTLSASQARGLKTPLARLESHVAAAITAARGRKTALDLYWHPSGAPLLRRFGQRDSATVRRISLQLQGVVPPSLGRALQVPQLPTRDNNRFDALCFFVLSRAWQVAAQRDAPFDYAVACETLVSELLTYEAR